MGEKTMGDNNESFTQDLQEFITSSKEINTTRILALFDSQKKLDEINRREAQELAKVHAKFEEVRCKIYEKRDVVIKSMPNFWLKTVCFTIESVLRIKN